MDKIHIRSLLNLYFAILLPFFWGCSQDHLYYKAYDLDPKSWPYEQKLDFQYHIADTSARYQMSLQIDHAYQYPYQNIYLKLYLTDTEGQSNEQIIPIDFAQKSGRLYGKCSGNICYLDAVLRQKIRYDKAGTYGLSISQWTRDENLKGIHKIALVIDKL